MLRKFFLTGIGLVLIGLARFAFNEISQLQYGLEHTGKLNVALSLAFLLSMPVITSFVPAALRFIASARGEGDDGRAHRIKVMLSGFTAVTLFLVSLVTLYFEDEIAASRHIDQLQVRYAVLVLVAFGVYQFARNLCYALGRVGAYTLLEGLAGVAFVLGLSILVFLDAKDHLLLAFACGYFFFAFLALFLFGRSPKSPPKAPIPHKEIWLFSFWAFVGTSASWGIRELSVVISPDFSNLEAAAHLGWCVAFLTPMQFLPRVVRTVIFADTAERTGRGEHDGAARSVSEVSHWIAIFNLPIYGLLFLVSADVLELLTNNTQADYIAVLQIMIIAVAFDTLATSASSTLSGAGHIKLNTAMSLLGLAAAILVWTGMGPSFGVLAVAAGLFTASAVRGTGVLIAAWKTLSIRVTHRPILCGGIILFTVIAYLGREHGGNSWWSIGLYILTVILLLRTELVALRAKIQQRVRG